MRKVLYFLWAYDNSLRRSIASEIMQVKFKFIRDSILAWVNWSALLGSYVRISQMCEATTEAVKPVESSNQLISMDFTGSVIDNLSSL